MSKQSISQRIISVLVTMQLIGCTSLQPVEVEPDELQDRIRHENIVNVGDRVKVFTEDGKEYRFQVTAIDAEAIRGEGNMVPIDSIVALESRDISIGKTTLLAGGVAGIVAIAFLVAIAIAPAAILASSAP